MHVDSELTSKATYIVGWRPFSRNNARGHVDIVEMSQVATSSGVGQVEDPGRRAGLSMGREAGTNAEGAEVAASVNVDAAAASVQAMEEEGGGRVDAEDEGLGEEEAVT